MCGIWKRVIQAFRIRAKAHNPHVGVTGVSDHLDRGQWGEWLDPHAGKPAPAPPPRPGLRGSSGSLVLGRRAARLRQPDRPGGEWPDPYERSKHFFCHPWEAWPGLAGVVAEQRVLQAALEAAERAKL